MWKCNVGDAGIEHLHKGCKRNYKCNQPRVCLWFPCRCWIGDRAHGLSQSSRGCAIPAPPGRRRWIQIEGQPESKTPPVRSTSVGTHHTSNTQPSRYKKVFATSLCTGLRT